MKINAEFEIIEGYKSAFMEGLAPPSELTVSEWADAHRILPSKASSEPGRWRTARTPYLKEIMDALSIHSGYRRVVFMKGTQLGGTEAGLNWSGYLPCHAPGPMLLIQPTVETAKRWSKQRLAATIEETPALRNLIKEARQRDSGNTVLCKEFPGGIMIISGANSAVSLRSMPIAYIMGDEIDAYPIDVEGEGDPISLAEKRTDNFPFSIIYLTSTPTIKGISRVEKEFLMTDRRHYFVPCPSCGHYQTIEFASLKWPRSKTGEHITEEIAMECEKCKDLIPEYHKTDMMARGEWRPTPMTPDQMKLLDITEQPECPPDVIGFRLPSYYSPIGWVSWKKIADEFLKAKRLKSRELLKTWVNCRAAETYEDRGEKPDEHILFNRREKYGPDVPEKGIILTCGVDVQDDRIEAGVKAWGIGEESWWITYEILYGDTTKEDVWNQLESFLKDEFDHVSGLPVKIISTCIDSGHRAKEVYEFVLRNQHLNIFTTKGSSNLGAPLVGRPSKKGVNPVNIFPIGTVTGKDTVFSRLRIKDPGPGYVHFPLNFDKEFFYQLTAEEVRYKIVNGNKVRFYAKIRDRNEVLDISVLNLAALIIRNVNLEKVAENFQKKIDKLKKSDGKDEKASGKNKRKRARRTGWVHRWRA